MSRAASGLNKQAVIAADSCAMAYMTYGRLGNITRTHPGRSDAFNEWLVSSRSSCPEQHEGYSTRLWMSKIGVPCHTQQMSKPLQDLIPSYQMLPSTLHSAYPLTMVDEPMTRRMITAPALQTATTVAGGNLEHVPNLGHVRAMYLHTHHKLACFCRHVRSASI